MIMKRIVPLLLFIAALPGLSWARGVDISDRPLDPTGLWQGHYNCAQGLTGLSLSIRSIDSVDLLWRRCLTFTRSVAMRTFGMSWVDQPPGWAVFDFYPLPCVPSTRKPNSDRPVYHARTNIWDADTQRLEKTTWRKSLIPEAWVDQPPGWDMVGLDLRPTQDFTLLTGLV